MEDKKTALFPMHSQGFYGIVQQREVNLAASPSLAVSMGMQNTVLQDKQHPPLLASCCALPATFQARG